MGTSTKLPLLELPLCREYALATTFQLPIRYAEGSNGAQLCVVLGQQTMEDGSVDVLSVTPVPALAPALTDDRLWNLSERGLERIQYLLLEHHDCANAYASTRPAQTGVVPLLGALLRAVRRAVSRRHRSAVARHLTAVADAASVEEAEAALALFAAGRWGEIYPALVQECRAAVTQAQALFAAPAEVRRAVRALDAEATALARSLQTSLRRHGPFADTAAGMAFVRAALGRHQRRWDRASFPAHVPHNLQGEGPDRAPRAFGA